MTGPGKVSGGSESTSSLAGRDSSELPLFARAPRLGWDSWGKGYELGATA